MFDDFDTQPDCETQFEEELALDDAEEREADAAMDRCDESMERDFEEPYDEYGDWDATSCVDDYNRFEEQQVFLDGPDY